MIPISVKWERERIHIDLPSDNVKLSVLRLQLAEYTQLDSFKLIHAGAVMKDDNAPLSAYSIHENSTITLIGSSNPLPPQHGTLKDSAVQKSEQSTITQIRSEIERVRMTLEPEVTTFLDGISPERGSVTKTLEVEHSRLAELLLQSLLRLDSIAAEGTWQHARTERKNAVKEVQALLDRLDDGWGRRSR